MSSPEAQLSCVAPRVATGLRRVCVVIAAGALALSVTACGNGGFQPLYGSAVNGPQGDARFAAVDFAPIPGRIGQRIRNELVFDKSSAGQVQPAGKRLEVVITESILTAFVKSDGNSTGQVYQIEANFRLINTATQKVEFQGRSLGRTNFDRFESIYSNVRARQDAEDRAAQTIAADIRIRLAAHLSRG